VSGLFGKNIKKNIIKKKRTNYNKMGCNGSILKEKQY
jgi:hypothetical protein